LVLGANIRWTLTSKKVSDPASILNHKITLSEIISGSINALNRSGAIPAKGRSGFAGKSS
jgi:hypothetical protein